MEEVKDKVAILLHELRGKIEGEVYTDDLHKIIYATDASVYRKIPMGVAYPKHPKDLQTIIKFSQVHGISLIPRTAGTSLAGQCVGEGLVVDVSRYFTKILHFDADKKTVTVQPGIIRDQLNAYLKPHHLFFAPNTSTSNRCMIGGMVGNNSSGTTSIQYGVTRDKVMRLKTILSDGSEALFEPISAGEFAKKQELDTLEGRIYKTLNEELSRPETQEQIKNGFPKEEIHRRNNGYPVDALLRFENFGGREPQINLATLLTGSEGTLAFSTEITLQLDDLPPPNNILVAAHFSSVQESMEAVVVAMRHNLYTCELMDKTILDCTKNNREQSKNRFFIEGDPAAVLMLEICTHDDLTAQQLADVLIDDLKQYGFGYAYPKLTGSQIDQAVELRKAGLGLLGNIVGDDKTVACIEDTAVEVKDLPNYIAEFTQMMDGFGQKAVYYAHAGAGELHLRPILNLKKEEDVVLFREITTQTAHLVKKYGGSFSGEHGNGIVRAEFIPLMVGEENYALMKRIKSTFDPQGIFNKGKIVDAYPMDKNLRYAPGRQEPEVKTIQDFSDSLGILRAAEKCNGSGDCRKLPEAGGTMCPSYRATRHEKDTTRARANALREFLTKSDKANKFDHKELYEVFDLCLSCKACASECPSNVDVAVLKAEFLYQYQKANGIPLRTRMFANLMKVNKLGSHFPALTNAVGNSALAKKIMGVAPQRSIPKLASTTFHKWYKNNKNKLEQRSVNVGEVFLFMDEFTNYYDVQIGIDCVELLTSLGYKVHVTEHPESGRSFISKGLLDEAKKLANANIDFFKNKVTVDAPLIGLEPSAILSFRDEYLRLAHSREEAVELAKHTFTVEEFIKREIERNHIRAEQFTTASQTVKIHGHCHQKSLSNMEPTFKMLSLPANYKVTLISSGCCGMAGSFGYEKEHYEVSMQVGEDTLFPKLRKFGPEVVIAAPGTSCRHQIMDGTQKMSLHPVSVLRKALLS